MDFMSGMNRLMSEWHQVSLQARDQVISIMLSSHEMLCEQYNARPGANCRILMNCIQARSNFISNGLPDLLDCIRVTLLDKSFRNGPSRLLLNTFGPWEVQVRCSRLVVIMYVSCSSLDERPNEFYAVNTTPLAPCSAILLPHCAFPSADVTTRF